MVPATRLLWCLAIIALPAAVLGGLLPGGGLIAIFVIAALGAVATVDALSSRDMLLGVTAQTPDLVRLYRDRSGEIPIQIHFDDPNDHTMRLALPLPESMETPEEVRTVRFAAIEHSEVIWTCTGRRRGKYPIDGLYIEAASRLGLWSLRRKLPLALELRVYPNLRHPDALAALRRGAQG